MVDKEVNDIFKDYKFDDSNEHSHDEVKKEVQREFNKNRFDEPEEKGHEEGIRELKEQINELREHIKSKEEVKEPKEEPEVKPVEHIKSEPKFKYFTKPGPGALERGVLIGIIVLLSAFIVVDLSFFHGKGVETGGTGVTGMVVGEIANQSEENKTGEKAVEEDVVEKSETKETVEEEKELSGNIELEINKIYKRKVNSNLGYITKVTFTINNGKDKALKPVVRVYAYDKYNDDPWKEKDRGVFNYTGGIVAGGEQAGSVDLTPKTFTSLNTIKTVVLKLYDEKGKLLIVADEKIYIE